MVIGPPPAMVIAVAVAFRASIWAEVTSEGRSSEACRARSSSAIPFAVGEIVPTTFPVPTVTTEAAAPCVVAEIVNRAPLVTPTLPPTASGRSKALGAVKKRRDGRAESRAGRIPGCHFAPSSARQKACDVLGAPQKATVRQLDGTEAAVVTAATKGNANRLRLNSSKRGELFR